MPDDKTRLPEGTDRVITGASEPTVSNSGAIGVGTGPGGNTGGAGTAGGNVGDDGEVMIETDTTATSDDSGGTTTGSATTRRGTGTGNRTGTGTGSTTTRSGGGGNAGRGAMDKIRSGGEKLSGQAADKARGLVGQGLERSAEALGNVGRMVNDTADGIDERLGPEYGDYARRAASAIEGTANSLANKDPDELIDDTREFVRRSPGVALAGAAIVGFALARLIKSGLARGDDENGGGTRGGSQDGPQGRGGTRGSSES